MHQSILAKRKAIAMQRIVTRASALVAHLELDLAIAEGLQPKGIKDAAVADMMRLERLADLVDRLADNAGLPQEAPAVSAVTAQPKQTPPAPPDADDLPEPVLDQDNTAEEIFFEDKPSPQKRKTTRRKKKA